MKMIEGSAIVFRGERQECRRRIRGHTLQGNFQCPGRLNTVSVVEIHLVCVGDGGPSLSCVTAQGHVPSKQK